MQPNPTNLSIVVLSVIIISYTNVTYTTYFQLKAKTTENAFRPAGHIVRKVMRELAEVDQPVWAKPTNLLRAMRCDATNRSKCWADALNFEVSL